MSQMPPRTHGKNSKIIKVFETIAILQRVPMTLKSTRLSPRCEVSFGVDLFMIKFTQSVRKKRDHKKIREKSQATADPWDFSHIKSRRFPRLVIISVRLIFEGNKVYLKLQPGERSKCLLSNGFLKRIYFGHRVEEENVANDISRLAWCVPFGSRNEKMEFLWRVTRCCLVIFFCKSSTGNLNFFLWKQQQKNART